MSTAAGQPAAFSSATRTAVARVDSICRRYRGFARKLKAPEPACDKVATRDIRKPGSPRSARPNRTANSPRLKSPCTGAPPSVRCAGVLLAAGSLRRRRRRGGRFTRRRRRLGGQGGRLGREHREHVGGYVERSLGEEHAVAEHQVEALCTRVGADFGDQVALHLADFLVLAR